MSLEYDKIDYNIEKNNDAGIKVIGVGGGGSNAINYLYNKSIGTLRNNVSFIICNTDLQALKLSEVASKIQIGDKLTEGRGAGNQPIVGEKSATESENKINSYLSSKTKIVFITAGMGGGTGTGAAPIIAKLSMKKNIVTVGIVTIPFLFEGTLRYNQAIKGINALKKNVDTLLIINNEQIKNIYGNLTISAAFSKVDDILANATKGIAEIINKPGKNINANFADVETIVRKSGIAIMGSGIGKGKDRAIDAIKAALDSPLLNDNDITEAKKVLLNIATGEKEITGKEVENIVKFIQDQLYEETELLRGDVVNAELTDEVMVTIIATGFEHEKSLDPISKPDIYVLDKKKKTETKKEPIIENEQPIQTSLLEPKTIKTSKKRISNFFKNFF